MFIMVNYDVVSYSWRNDFPFLAMFSSQVYTHSLIPAQDWTELEANYRDCLEHNEISCYTQLKSFRGTFK